MSAPQSAPRAVERIGSERIGRDSPALAEAALAGPTARDLLLADHVMVQRQNIHWLSHRFNFHAPLADFLTPRSGRVAALEDALADPINRLPTWRRWTTLLRRAVAGDEDARDRIRAAVWLRLGRGEGGGPRPIPTPDSEAIDEETYAAWLKRYDGLSALDEAALAVAADDPALPAVTVLVRVGPEAVAALPDRLRELGGQIHRRWRAVLVLVHGVTAEVPEIAAALREEARLGVADGTGLAGLDEGLVVLVEGSARLRPETLLAFAETWRATPGLALIYADDDRIGADGTRSQPRFKPGFSPALSQRLAYLGSCVAAEAGLVRRVPVGALTVAAWASRAAAGLERAQVAHVPRILSHRAEGDADLALTPPPLPRQTPTVAIVIPTKNHAALLSACIESIRRVTDYPAEQISFVIIDNGSDEAEALALLARLEGEARVTVLRDPSPFNYARLNNLAARAAASEVLLFLNNDTEIDDPQWLASLASWAVRPEIGVVGPKLLYPDGTVQHAGVVLGIAGVAGHSFVGIGGNSPGYMGLAGVTREVAALTGACIAVRRAVFEEVGGFNERLEIAFNDTALCSDVFLRGYRNLYVGETRVIHHESKSRGFDDTPEKLARFRQECQLVRVPYKALFDDDPFYNPNLALFRPYQPAIPRAARPWRGYRRRIDAGLRVLILSDVHAVGHGVPVVIKQHAEALAGFGCTVFVGGAMQPNEITYEGCFRVYFDGPGQAQSFAYEADVDCVISHTIPYFSMFRSMGAWPKRVIFDHGEPPPAWFPADRQDRENIDAEKQFCYRIVDLVLTNTATVKDEIGFAAAEVAGLGNAHLAVWDGVRALRRDAIRAAHGWAGKIVVLNVSRFHRAERRYKGIDEYVALKRRVAAEDAALAGRLVFVLVGKGTEQDREEMAAEGLEVFASVSDAELADLYAAADVYANFSKWEGFNLGIAQALAMGLEVVASAIPAHRAFPIETSDDEGERARLLAGAAGRSAARERRAVLMPWEGLNERLHRRLVALCGG